MNTVAFASATNWRGVNRRITSGPANTDQSMSPVGEKPSTRFVYQFRVFVAYRITSARARNASPIQPAMTPCACAGVSGACSTRRGIGGYLHFQACKARIDSSRQSTTTER